MKFLNLLVGCSCAAACVLNIMENDAVMATIFGICSFLNVIMLVQD